MNNLHYFSVSKYTYCLTATPHLAILGNLQKIGRLTNKHDS